MEIDGRIIKVDIEESEVSLKHKDVTVKVNSFSDKDTNLAQAINIMGKNLKVKYGEL